MNDVPELMKQRSDERVNKYLERSNSITIEQAEQFVHKIDETLAERSGVYWVLSLKEDAALIGTICYWNLQPEKSLAEIGYEISPDYQGKGLMQEAVKKVIEYGFSKMELKIITALPDKENEKSIVLLERNNFRRDNDYQYVSKEDAGEQAVYILTSEDYR